MVSVSFGRSCRNCAFDVRPAKHADGPFREAMLPWLMHTLIDGRATRGRGPEAHGFRGERAQCQHLSLSVSVWADEFIRPTARRAT
jgi:hypothetical protein